MDFPKNISEIHYRIQIFINRQNMEFYEKFYAWFVEQKIQGYFDARTEFDFVTHFWEYLA